MRASWLALVLGASLPIGLDAQDRSAVQAARAAYDRLDFSRAIELARHALGERLDPDERVDAYELLALSYGAVDSSRQAVDAFRELIFLDPNRELDVDRVSPRITALYGLALGQVLVVRRIALDSATFVAGSSATTMRYEVSRAARTTVRVVGHGRDIQIDSQLASGRVEVHWPALGADGSPLPAGVYELVVTATERRNAYASRLTAEVLHGRVDTLAHLTRLPGYEEQPEFDVPPYSWRPLGIALLYAGLAVGGVLALENPLGGSRRELAGVGLAVLAAGVGLSLRTPEPRPNPAAILLNRFIREELERRNAEVARANLERRRQVLITVRQSRGEP